MLSSYSFSTIKRPYSGLARYALGLLALAPLAVGAQRPVHPQTVVPASPGSLGSYSSAPPTPTTNTGALDTARYDFYYRSPLYVARAVRQQHPPIPTNDWWTDLLINGKNGGLLWVYPLVVDPDPQGVNINFPNSIDVRAGGYDMHYGGSLRIRGAGYTPSTAQAERWSDWGLVMGAPDTVSGKGLTVTMAHGVPFAWVETAGNLSPQLGFEKAASCLDASGAPLTFPHQGSFVVNTDGRYFGLHLPPTASLQQDTLKYAQVDLGQVRSLSEVKLYWEAAYAKSYDVQVSDDGQTWRTALARTGYVRPSNGLDDINLAGQSGRYLRLLLRKRATPYGYSLYEIQAYAAAGALVSQGQPVSVSSVENGGLLGQYLTDGDLSTRWASDANQAPVLVLALPAASSYFVVSGLNAPADLTAYEQYAFNKVADTRVDYAYDTAAGKVALTWNLTTTNLQTGAAGGSTLQGFLPHLTQNTANSLTFTPYTYVSPRGALTTTVGTSFAFTYDFNGVIPAYNAPYRDAADAHPYDAKRLFDLVSAYAANPSDGNDTYFGGKDLVQHMKFALLAKQLNHQAYPALKEKARASLVNWLTYTPGETQRYFARYDRWGALIGFNPSFGSDEFVDNHFHYGYFTLACALYGMLDPDFLKTENYGGMARQIAQQYANWDRTDARYPWLRTFDPWVGHSYAGGTSSGNGNNQESSSEAMQSWLGLFLLGDALQDPAMRAAGAFGYASESAACLEYWFDWKGRNFPAGYDHRMGAILSNQGLAHGTYFGAQEKYVHGIEYLPINPGLTYLARDPAWAQREYNDLLTEAKANQGEQDELDFGADWTHVVLGFRYLWDPQYVTSLLEANYQLPTSSPRYIMGDKEVAGITYSYAHAQQNLGLPSTRYHTDFPTSTVFEKNGQFSRAVAYNPTDTDQVSTVRDAQGQPVRDGQGNVIAQLIPAHQLVTFPTPPTTGLAPTGCYNLVAAGATASSGNALLGVDGDQGSRWESAQADPQQFTVDYGTPAALSTITITWENASAKNYQLLGSLDGTNWTVIQDNSAANFPTLPAGQTRTDSYAVSGTYRYVRMAGTQRTTPYGYSFYELTTCGAAATTASAPLPVQLVDFTAQAQGTAIALAWHTASEVNSDHFELERSLDGVAFSRLASVAAQGAAATPSAYAYRDAALPAGASQLYYRLRQVDHDGTAVYSPVRSVALARAAGLLLWPNPTHTGATLQGAAAGTPVALLDALGRTVATATADASGMAHLLLPTGLATGVYVVRAGSQALRLVVQ